jgi:hypothetical protein
LIFDAKGALYGTAGRGGKGLSGVAFRIRPGSDGHWAETVLYAFSDGNAPQNPTAGVISDGRGNLYGPALGGVTARGVIYRLKNAALGGFWPLTVLYTLNGSSDGHWPEARLAFDSAGNLYSTTQGGGSGSCQNGCGTVFEVSQ